MTITRALPSDAGCYVDGHWGHYAAARMIEVAESFGYDDAESIELAGKKLAAMMPSLAPELSDDEEDKLPDCADDAEQWLNDHVAPEGFSFGWYDGEFFMWENQLWEEM